MAEVKTRIGKKFSLTLPKDIIEKFDLKEGDLVTVKKDKNVIIIIPEKISPFQKLSKLIGDVNYNDKTEVEVENFITEKISRITEKISRIKIAYYRNI